MSEHNQGGGAGGDGSAAPNQSGEPGGSSSSSSSAAAVEQPAWAKELNENMRQLAAMAQQASQERQAQIEAARQQQHQVEQPEEEDEENVDLELISRADFAKHIVRRVEQAINKNVVEPLSQQLSELRATTTRDQLGRAVQELRSKYPDFNEWSQDMIELAKEQPTLPPHRLYILARGENPTKAKAMDAKYAPRDQGNVRNIRFGGLTPSQSGSGSRARNMAPAEAGKAAWDDTVAALGVPDFGDEE